MNNNKKNKSPHAMFKDMADDTVALQILEIIEKSPYVTQGTIKSQTGIAAGLVHSFMQTIISKGWVRAKQVSPKRWLYFITPEGFYEKSRLTIAYLSKTVQDYRSAQRLVNANLQVCLDSGWSKLIVAGKNDLAEIAALNINVINGLELVGIVAEDGHGETFAGSEILPFTATDEIEFDRILICDVAFIKWLQQNGDEDKTPLLLHL